jgi:hypothetical protein
VKKTLTHRAIAYGKKNSANLGKAALLTTLIGLFLAWIVPKLLDSSWERLCKWKEEADQVPALVLTVSNLEVNVQEQSRNKWAIYALSNRIDQLERKR